MFSVDVVNTKVVDNSRTFLVLKFHEFRATDLRVIDFTSPLSGFARDLCRSQRLRCLDSISFESCISDNIRVVEILLRSPNCPRTPFLVV